MSFDYVLFKEINSMAGKFMILDTAMVFISKYMLILYCFVLLLLWFSGTKVARRAALYSVLSALLALGLAQIPGLIFFRPRPFSDHTVNLLINKSPDSSFPSDHATGSAALSAGIMNGSRIYGYVSWGMCFLLAFSRVYVGTHYPLDVLTGIVLGIIANWSVKKTSFLTLPLLDYCIGKVDKHYNLR